MTATAIAATTTPIPGGALRSLSTTVGHLQRIGLHHLGLQRISLHHADLQRTGLHELDLPQTDLQRTGLRVADLVADLVDDQAVVRLAAWDDHARRRVRAAQAGAAVGAADVDLIIG